ncbi:hypothetical protein FRY98_02995 [Paenibacillus faecis]|uniref:Uncharacterized protein n=1 Tax=Paenibacillus faecis TaxID=862114 RepID=A0A5D0CZC0_9BACL|nr:DUF6033 family protein [Paenibacillus faecis]TYA14664.1 hypothetical protein FRY98_02995 [Paenibacillus faecis]
MSITLPATNIIPLTRPTQQKNKATADSSSVVFNKTLTAFTATESEVEAISKKYGLSVGVETIPRNEKEVVRRGASGSLQDVVIAPNILETMKVDPVLKEKIYGYINYYTNEDRAAFENMELFGGVKLVGRSLIIHPDGTYTIWSASETSPEEVEKGKKIEAEKQKENAEKARQAAEKLEESGSVVPSYFTYSLPSQAVNPLLSSSSGAMTTQDWVRQNFLLRAKKLNEINLN